MKILVNFEDQQTAPIRRPVFGIANDGARGHVANGVRAFVPRRVHGPDEAGEAGVVGEGARHLGRLPLIQVSTNLRRSGPLPPAPFG